MAIDTSDFKNGLRIMIDNDPWTITYFQHVKPGKGGAFVRSKIRNLRTGQNVERTFRAGERFQEADVADSTMQYLYQDGDLYVFMDNKTYDQMSFTPEQIGDGLKFLQENMEVKVLIFQGTPLAVELPHFLKAEVTQTDPGEKGNTATGATKPATLETGAVVNVPLFINEGDRVRIDTRTGEYIERVKED